MAATVLKFDLLEDSSPYKVKLYKTGTSQVDPDSSGYLLTVSPSEEWSYSAIANEAITGIYRCIVLDGDSITVAQGYIYIAADDALTYIAVPDWGSANSNIAISDLSTQIGTLGSAAGGIAVVATDFTLTTGSVAGGSVSVVNQEDGVYHIIDDSGNTTDFYYEFSVGENGVPQSFQWTGYAQSSGDSYGVYAYNWITELWEQVGTISGAAGTTNATEQWLTTISHVGEGANEGVVRVRFYSTDGTRFATDRMLCIYAVVSPAVDDSQLATDWKDGGRLDLLLDTASTDATASKDAAQQVRDDWINGGRLDVILDSILQDTSTDIPSTLTAINNTVSTINTTTTDILTDTGTTLPATLTTINGAVTAVQVTCNAILTDTDALVTDVGSVDTKIDTLQSTCNDILTDTGVSIPATLSSMDAVLVAVFADTNQLQAEWTDGGRLDLILDAVKTDSTAILSDSNAILEDTGTTIPATITTLQSTVNKVPRADSDLTDGEGARWQMTTFTTKDDVVIQHSKVV